jgi:hypothetical protein
MRIISGKWRGRRLVSFKADHIRPTTDRVKESLFNKLQAEWEDARVLDLYAGTGNIGFEALSRGAREVVAVEMSGKSIDIIRRNIVRACRLAREYRVMKDDVVRFFTEVQGGGLSTSSWRIRHLPRVSPMRLSRRWPSQRRWAWKPPPSWRPPRTRELTRPILVLDCLDRQRLRRQTDFILGAWHRKT